MANRKPLYNVQIDPEFETLMNPLTDDEYRRLKENIREYGLQQKILVWFDPKSRVDLIVDGHNRFRILQELSKESGNNLINDSCYSSGCLLEDREEVKAQNNSSVAYNHLKNLYQAAQLYQVLGTPDPEDDNEGCESFLNIAHDILSAIQFFHDEYHISLDDIQIIRKIDTFGKERYSAW